MKTNEQIETAWRTYVRKEKRYETSVVIGQVALLLLFFTVWQIASSTALVDPLLFSSPLSILTRIGEGLTDGTLWPHMTTTLLETISAFLISSIVGVCIAALLWYIPLTARLFDPFLVTLNALPKVALGPIIIIVFGPTVSSSIAMGVLVSIIVTIIVVYEAFRTTDPNYLKLLRTFGANKAAQFRYAVLPAARGTILATLKVNVGLAWVGVIVGEFLVSKQGLGYLIVYGFQMFDSTLVLASVALICVLALLMYAVQAWVERRLG
ncbi:MAG: ABC transporter permease [Bacilli bacterium]